MNEITSGGTFDVGINDRLPLGQLLMLGLQHVFGMTGMFVLPGLLGGTIGSWRPRALPF